MSSYMQSNQPYRRVEDGIGNGLFVGGLMGAGVAAGVQFGAKPLSKAMRNSANFSLTQARDDIRYSEKFGQPRTGDQVSRLTSAELGAKNAQRRDLQTKQFVKNRFGSGKAKAISYGAGILGGAILGTGLDALND